MKTPPKYPSTPHWPFSETVHRDDTVSVYPNSFVGEVVIVTEKIDGGNTCLFNGEVYARSVAAPCREGWMGMVRKHHGWKTNGSRFTDYAYYGEDIFGIHSIEYEPVREEDTFHLFAVQQTSQEYWCSWSVVEDAAKELDIPLAPVLFHGVFYSQEDITKFFREELKKPSCIGGEREGFVMRTFSGFSNWDFRKSVCKYVRPNHVQTDQHWRRHWRTCPLIGEE